MAIKLNIFMLVHLDNILIYTINEVQAISMLFDKFSKN